jgi:hypothetical protein
LIARARVRCVVNADHYRAKVSGRLRQKAKMVSSDSGIVSFRCRGTRKTAWQIAKKDACGVCDVTRLKYPWHNVGIRESATLWIP